MHYIHHRPYPLWKSLLLLLLFLSLLLSVPTFSHLLKTSRTLTDGVLRLHIIANSNDAFDQQLKLAVRDRILLRFSPCFQETISRSAAEDLGRLLLPTIQKEAEAELRRHGCMVPVRVHLEEKAFPTKTYGNLRLPRGRYIALCLSIGAAVGENWWCVLYPPLCLTRGAVEADPSTMEKLEEILSPAELALLCETDSVQIHTEFRLLEWIHSCVSHLPSGRKEFSYEK